MLVGSSIRGNAAAAKSRYLSQVEKRYVTSARGLGEYLAGARLNLDSEVSRMVRISMRDGTN